MVYIPFPSEDFNDDADLAAWRNKANKQPGDWGDLKVFIAKQPRLWPEKHPLPKCWYSELPQGDNYALDVEHFRPKNQASPLNSTQSKKLKQKTGFTLQQADSEGAYPWLEFDYRNYRLVTALTNRAGAKHVYFPIAKGTIRLPVGTLAWATPEYPYFLDPADPHDASLLLVKPNGEIIPRSPKTELTDSDFAELSNSWRSDGFNYMRAEVTILMYRLNERLFQEGRKEVYDNVNDLMSRLQDCLPDDQDRLIRLKDKFIADLVLAVSPSAPFALAARCALEAYLAPANLSNELKDALEGIAHQILDRIKQEVSNKTVAWDKP